jgi:hypothetical protein
MGRQKTLWINEECWEKLMQMEGDSISAKVRTAIMSHELDRESQVNALKRQIKVLEQAKYTRRTMQ